MPSNALSETKACDLLARLFRSRGYAIERNVPFSEYGVSFHIDGWDRTARVGFEFLSSEDEDHDDLTLREYQTLMAAQLRGEISLFVIDEVEPLSSQELRLAAEDFLEEVATAVRARKSPAKAKVAKRAASAKAPVLKPKAKKKPAAPRSRRQGTSTKTPKATGKKTVRRKPR